MLYNVHPRITAIIKILIHEVKSTDMSHELNKSKHWIRKTPAGCFYSNHITTIKMTKK